MFNEFSKKIKGEAERYVEFFHYLLFVYIYGCIKIGWLFILIQYEIVGNGMVVVIKSWELPTSISKFHVISLDLLCLVFC